MNNKWKPSHNKLHVQRKNLRIKMIFRNIKNILRSKRYYAPPFSPMNKPGERDIGSKNLDMLFFRKTSIYKT